MEKVWFKKYQKGVPHEINPDRYASINDIFEESMSNLCTQTLFCEFWTVPEFLKK